MERIEKKYQALTGMLPEEITDFCGLAQKFRGAQIFEWIAKGVFKFDEMTNLPIQLQKSLNSDFSASSTKIASVLKDPDGTVKLVIELHDGIHIETVLLSDKNGRKTACVSSQAGCPLSCAFCKTGQLGFSRNLRAEEITEQFFHLEKTVGKLDNIVFMGMGEPMLNLAAVKKAVEILTHPKGRALSKRRITVSTAGICEGIYRITDSCFDVRLAVSLTSADIKLRSSLMPVEKNNPLPELKKAIAYYNEKTGRRVTLELALMRGVNTSEAHAEKVKDFASGLNVHINLIAWNPIETLNFETPTMEEVSAFEKMLLNAGLNVTIRRRRGKKIGGACGQLGKLIKPHY